MAHRIAGASRMPDIVHYCTDSERRRPYAPCMPLQYTKMIIAGLWILTALVIAIAIGPSLVSGLLLAAFGLLPPLAILLLWNEPAQTMSERIRDAQRRA